MKSHATCNKMLCGMLFTFNLQLIWSSSMDFSISVSYYNGSTRVNVAAGGQSAIFVYWDGVKIDNPIVDLFGPASGGCESLQEFFDALSRRVAIISNPSGTVKSPQIPLELVGGGVSAHNPLSAITTAQFAALRAPSTSEPGKGFPDS